MHMDAEIQKLSNTDKHKRYVYRLTAQDQFIFCFFFSIP